MIPRRLITTPLLAVLATGLVACGGGSAKKTSAIATSSPAKSVFATIRGHYVNLANANVTAACNDQTVQFQNSFASTFKTDSCPAAMLAYRQRLALIGPWTTKAMRSVAVTGLRVTGDSATATVKLSNPSGGIDVPMGQVSLVRVGKQWMISNVNTN